MSKFHRDIERDAIKLRKEYGINGYGIENIFSLTEKMDIILIRYPMGKDTLCGFCTVYEGKKVIVSNSNEILAREIFTIAHEIGHFQYDIDNYSNAIKIDKNIEDDANDKVEQRANLFAAAFLMPKSVLCEYIENELDKSYKELSSIDIVKIQSEFNVSYSAVVFRLFNLDLISIQHKNKLFEDRKQKTSRFLFDMINADKNLLYSYNKIYVPSQYFEFVVSNYQNDYVSFDKFKEALNIIDVKEEIIEGLRKEEVIEDDAENWDDIDFDYFE